MNIKLPGDKTKVICEKCGAVRSATWNYDDYLLEEGTVVQDVMLARCDVCGEQAGLAQQSACRIRQAREKAPRTCLTLSRPIMDLANVKVSEAGANIQRAVELITRAFLSSLLDDERRRDTILQKVRTLQHPLLDYSATKQVNVRFSRSVLESLENLVKRTRLRSRSELIRRIVVLSDEDEKIETELKKNALAAY